jgi:hypothetical protein
LEGVFLPWIAPNLKTAMAFGSNGGSVLLGSGRRTVMAKGPDIKFLGRLATWRNDAQLILFDLLSLVSRKKQRIKADDAYNAIFQLLVGTAFSLWRAVFLADQPFRPAPALGAAETFLTKVVSDNAIGYSDEKSSRRWTAGFYVSHIQYRMYHLQLLYGQQLQVKALDDYVATWSPFKKRAAPQNEILFFDETINCLQKVTVRLNKLVP